MEKNFISTISRISFYKKIFSLLFLATFFQQTVFADYNQPQELVIVGGGIAGFMEVYFAHVEAEKNNRSISITIYEKNDSIAQTTVSNNVPSLTCDEIISVVPRGQELKRKLEIPFNQPGGIRVDDVPGIDGSQVTEQFKEQVQIYSLDELGHQERTQHLLALGKMSMDMWQELYDTGDAEFKAILDASNYNPCREPLSTDTRVLHDGYRIDLIYNVPNPQERAEGMIRDYKAVGCNHCAILTPDEVAALDPFLENFCKSNSVDGVWNQDTIAVWRPGGCIDTQTFLPKLYAYLKKHRGDDFQIYYGKKVTSVEFAQDNSGNLVISGLGFEDGQSIIKDGANCQFVFCPGEAVGTLHNLGFAEPAYAGFAGVSLLLDIQIPEEKIEEYSKFNHCMEVCQEGIVLAWQARFRNNKIFIGVAGTKSFYSDQLPNKDQAFAKDRNILQLNMINDVLPQFISEAFGYDTLGKKLTQDDLDYLESQGIARRWAGVRAVVYDGFPTVGYLYKDGARIENARCTTHLGSGGGSFAPAAVFMSRNALEFEHTAFQKSILKFADSSRNAEYV